MGIAKAIRQSCATFSLLAGAVAVSATNVQAQTFSDVQSLAFYPAPLSNLATAPLAVAACDCTFNTFNAAADGLPSYEAAFGSVTDRALEKAPEVLEAGNYLQDIANRRGNSLSSRARDGLYSPDQIEQAERSIESLTAVGRFDEAEAKYNQLLDIHRKVHGSAAPQTAHTLLGLGELQLMRLQQDLGRFDVLQQAQSHFVDAIRMLIGHEAWGDPAILALEQNLVHTYYLDALRTGVLADPFAATKQNQASQSRLHAKANGAALPEQYLKGKQAYLRMLGYLQKNPAVEIATIAHVMLGLADWHLLFGEPTEANQQYRQLEEVLAAAGTAPAETAAILHPALPTTLPAFVDSALSPKAISETSSSLGYVDVSFNVDHFGRATKVAVLGTSDGASHLVTDHLEKLVRNAHFRPAADAGAKFSLRYYYSY